METIELVIRISEKHYNMITDDINLSADEYPILHQRIAEGIMLPKGHGRLIDVDKMIADFVDSQAISLKERFKISNIVEHQKTIIEADEEGAEE